MAFQFTNAATSDIYVVYDRLVDFAVAQGWTESIAREDWTSLRGLTEKRCQLLAPGHDANHRMHIQLQTMHNPTADKWEIQCRPVFSYNAVEDYDNQLFMSEKQTWGRIPLGNEAMRTWISVTNTRMILVVDIGGTNQLLAVQFPLTGLPVDDSPYPVLMHASYGIASTVAPDLDGAASDDNGNTGYRYDSGSSSLSMGLFHTSNVFFNTRENIIASATLNGRTIGVKGGLNGAWFDDRSPLPDGTRALVPCVIYDRDGDHNYEGVLCTVDGLFFVNGDGLSPEDTVTVSGVVHTVFKNISRVSNNDFFVLENL